MRTKLIVVATILSIAFGACKNEPKEAAQDAPKEEVKKNFSVELDVVSPNKDDFSVFYTEDNTINFNGNDVVWHGVVPQAESQNLVFDFKEEILPTHIRIDFGLVQDKGDVTLKKFKMSYKGKDFEAKGSDFLKYFIPNETVQADVDTANGTIRIQKLPNKPYTPFFYPQQAIIDEIAKLTN